MRLKTRSITTSYGKVFNMKNKTLRRPLRFLLNYKIWAIFLVISSVWIGIPRYIKHSVEKFTQQHELEIDIDSIHFNWRIWKLPSITLNKIDIKNKGIDPTFTHIKAKDILIEPNYSEFIKSYCRDYIFLLKITNLKVLLINGSNLEADSISSNLAYRNNMYHINNLNIHPFRIKLDSKHSSCKKNDKEETCEGRLIISAINGKGQYNSLARELEIYLNAPPASTRGPEGTAYSLQAKGKIKFLGLMPYQYAKNPEDPGVRGKITYTIDNFSTMLHQLHQAKLISTLAENLGTIIGYPIPRVDPFTQQTEIFTNAVSLDMTFERDGTYIGPMKL
jgi:hypothetical protein